MITPNDIHHLNLCIKLAKEALAAGDRPFGSVLVSNDGKVLMQERNRINSVGATFHPEIEIARWASENLTAQQRTHATVYTSGEHCPMCVSAHTLAGLGRIVYASSSQQLSQWLTNLGASDSPVRALAINDIAPNINVLGPVPELASTIENLHREYYQQSL